MQIIHYGESTYVTGDDIAHAVLDYAKALAQADSADTVSLPFRRDDDTQGELELLIGPASQIVLEGTDAAGAELRDPATVDDIMRRVCLLSRDATQPIEIADQDGAVLRTPEDL